jgi:hypothetical protein
MEGVAQVYGVPHGLLTLYFTRKFWKNDGTSRKKMEVDDPTQSTLHGPIPYYYRVCIIIYIVRGAQITRLFRNL